VGHQALSVLTEEQFIEEMEKLAWQKQGYT
jgi:hypothetical protein